MKKKRTFFNVIIERDLDGYYVATVPELKGCHTQAKSLDTLMKRIREVIDLCLDVQKKSITYLFSTMKPHGNEVPKLIWR